VLFRSLPEVGYLRAANRVEAITGCLHDARDRNGVRIVHFSIQGNHLHLIVEADDSEALARGIQGFVIRLARALNAVTGRKGKVFADRFHAHVLRTRAEAAHAIRYVLENWRHHLRPDVSPRNVDPYSSVAWLVVPPPSEGPVVAPRTWLLRSGWIPPRQKS